jgi:ribosomal protein S18 acetylase RimI-like enzyme
VHVRRLAPDDGSALEVFFAELDDYVALFGAAESSAAVTTYIALPEGKSYDDKYLFGVWSADERLVGAIDLVVDYPHVDVWTVGLVVLAIDERGRGVGTRLMDWLMVIARGEGAHSVRIAPRQDNSRCAHFLRGLGFTSVRGSRERETVVFERGVDDWKSLTIC